MKVYVLTVIYNLDACEVWGVYTSQSDADNAQARLVGYYGTDVHEVQLDGPPPRGDLHEGPLTRKGHMTRRWDE